MLGQMAGADGVLGVDQIQNRHVAQQQLAEEIDGLEADVTAQIRVLGPSGISHGVGRFVAAQVSRVEPLLDEALGENERPVVTNHTAYEFAQYLGVVQLAVGGQVEQQLIRHAAPEKVGKPRGQSKLIEGALRRGGVGWLGAKQEQRRHQRAA